MPYEFTVIITEVLKGWVVQGDFIGCTLGGGSNFNPYTQDLPPPHPWSKKKNRKNTGVNELMKTMFDSWGKKTTTYETLKYGKL